MRSKVRHPSEEVRVIIETTSFNPTLYQINTRVWLNELSQTLGRPATLDDIPDSFLDQLSGQGFEWVYLLGVWQTGSMGQTIARTTPSLVREYKAVLPDLKDEDIGSSGFATTGYTLSESLGDPAALTRLRKRLNGRGIKLMLDFIPNHTAKDHPWVSKHPDYYVGGSEEQLARSPQNYQRMESESGSHIFAYGRDPYFDGWTDTFQLNYGNPALHEAMRNELSGIATVCDGVRCDMAMLVLPDIFRRTWKIDMQPFWSVAIEAVKKKHPDFIFMAEVYWDLEWELQQQGFDYTYDKRLYDRLLQHKARPVREHLWAELDYQKRSARFLENHDEKRAASEFNDAEQKCAALITYLPIGLKFFHDGQLQGYKKREPVQLLRRAVEPENPNIAQFYKRLLQCLKMPIFHRGSWKLLECGRAWDGNWTWDEFISFMWSNEAGDLVVVAINYSAHQSQCYVKIPADLLDANAHEFTDLMSDSSHSFDVLEVKTQGLFLDLGPWEHRVFYWTPEKVVPKPPLKPRSDVRQV